MKTTDKRNAGALPPASEPAGAPELPDFSGVYKTGAHRCRDCGTVLTEPGRQLCSSCREASKARHREQKRLYQRARQAEGKVIRKKKKKPGSEPRACKALGCGGTVKGRELYCESCRRERREAARKKYRASRYVDPLPLGPPTTMDWLRKFDAWAKSGLSYTTFQIQEKEKPVRRKKPTAPAH